ncbi:YdeI/OmpD-associated family protein [Pseudoduganella sp. RAF53_2]|uniref:YdeI/OmpD-associated family protein n=1 Tax=unclassified Pseudoduganella TaxID=2637179 RepID=UPI003F97C317
MSENPAVNAFLGKATSWKEEMTRLREIVLSCELKEEMKWGQPCYTLDGDNIVLIHGFKEYCALLFFKGALMKDPNGILIQQTENVQSARQIRFTNLKEITKSAKIVKAYIEEAIKVGQSGQKVEFKETREYPVPEELQIKFDELPGLRDAFYALTPGRQRGYLLHFAAPKLSKTRESRVEKCMDQILEGRGLND